MRRSFTRAGRGSKRAQSSGSVAEGARSPMRRCIPGVRLKEDAVLRRRNVEVAQSLVAAKGGCRPTGAQLRRRSLPRAQLK